jgi:choline-glycine betaine transporter
MEKVKEVLKANKMSVILSVLLLVVLLTLVVVGADGSTISAVFHDMCIASRPVTYGLGAIFIISAILISYSPMGKLKLGGENAKVEYSTFSWISMLFAAGSGVGLLFYSSEGIMHMNNNPFYASATAVDGCAMAMFNWTIIPWTIYGILGLVLAYFHYNRGKQLKLSSALPDGAPVWLKHVVDAIMVFSILGGLCTSLGLGVTQLTDGLNHVLGIEISPLVAMVLLEIVAVISVMTGINKGIKILSNTCSVLAVVFLGLIAMYSYSAAQNKGLEYAQFEFLGASLGAFCDSFVDFINPVDSKSLEWSASWAVFYQLWFAAWAAFVSSFIVKISKGRTVKSFLFNVIIIPSIFAWLWFGIIGYAEMDYTSTITNWINDKGLTIAFFDSMNILSSQSSIPAGGIVLGGCALILLGLFFITSSDSGSYVVASLVKSGGPVTPGLKLYWAVVELVVAFVLYQIGGLSMVQIASVMVGILVFLLTGYGLYAMIKDYKSKLKDNDK